MKFYYWLGGFVSLFLHYAHFFFILCYGIRSFSQNHAFLVNFDNSSAEFSNSFNFSIGKIIMTDLDCV